MNVDAGYLVLMNIKANNTISVEDIVKNLHIAGYTKETEGSVVEMVKNIKERFNTYIAKINEEDRVA